MNMSFYVCTILYQYLIYYDIIWWTYDGYHIILPGIDRCLPSMARHIPFRPHGVTDLSHSRRRPAPVDSCLDEVFRDAIGGQMLMDFPQIGKNDVGWCRKSSSWLNIQNTKSSTINTIGYNWWILLRRKVRDRKSRSPSLDQRLLRFFGPWVLERKPYCDWRDTQWLKLDSFSRFVNLYYQLSFSLFKITL